MTRHLASSIGPRAVLRWWPLILLPAVLAVAGALWSVSHQPPSYTATTRMVVTPLVQWDETFIGTSLIRDAGDPKITAATAAELLHSRRASSAAATLLGGVWTPDAVDAAVDVTAEPDTNVVQVTAHSADAALAQRLSSGYAEAAAADRWQTIATELDARIAAITATTAADPNAGEASARLQTLALIRQAGADPTLHIDSTGPAVPQSRLPKAVVIGLAAVGGLFVGLLCAIGLVRLRLGQRGRPADPPPVVAVPTESFGAEPVSPYSSNGGG